MPTPRQIQINAFQNIFGSLYVAALLFCLTYLIYSVVMEIRDWNIRRKLKKFYRENPIEWILDFEEYVTERNK